MSPDAAVDTAVRVEEGARIEGTSVARGASRVEGVGILRDNAMLNESCVRDNAIVAGEVRMHKSCIYEDAKVWGKMFISGDTEILGNAHIGGEFTLRPGAEIGHFAWIMRPNHYVGGMVGIYAWDAYLCWNPKHPGYYVNVHFGCQTMPLSCWTMNDGAKINYWAPFCDRTIGDRPLYWAETLDRIMDHAEKSIIVPDMPPDFSQAPKP